MGGEVWRMRYAIFAAFLLLGACATAPADAQAQCQPAGFSRAELDALKAAEWELPDGAQRNALALALARECLASPDPTLRDGIAFEALAHWLRAQQLTNETMLAIADNLEPRLAAPEGAGFERPFAALVLSEIARADRVAPYMTDARRRRLLDASLAYFTSVRDYRGFDEREGWRHGVAHGADLLLQLSLNPAFGRDEALRIRDAIEMQVAPAEHFYNYGESERLARPIIFMAQRGLITEEEWTAWFARFPTGGDEIFASQAGLARRHDVNAFLQVIWLNARLSESAADDVLLPGAEAAMRAMP